MNPSNDHSKPCTPIGCTDFRNERKPFGIRLHDRFSHVYALGKTGSGKTTLLLKMAVDDVRKGYGVALIEPHGDACHALLAQVPEHRKRDIVYFDPTNAEHRMGFNPLRGVPAEERHLVASEIVLAFKKIWADSWGPRLEYILRYSILTLLEYPVATLLDIQPLLLDHQFRNMVLHYADNAAIRSFWLNEFEKYPPSLRAEAIMPILNKAGAFSANAVLRDVVGQQEGISIERIMNDGKILVCNLSKGVIGEDATRMLGSLICTGIQTVAMRRARMAEDDRRPFMVFVDECHSFITGSLAEMLSEIRKYRVGLFLSHQYMDQLAEDVLGAVLGNAGTVICFRLGARDAKVMAEEFYPVFKMDDFTNLSRFCFYIRLLIDGIGSRPFSAEIAKSSSQESKEINLT